VNDVATLRSVRQALEAFAEEHGLPAAEFAQAKVDEHLERSLPRRYRRLAAEVVLRLPDGWDSHVNWTICADDPTSGFDTLLAGVRRLEVKTGGRQGWKILLVPQSLDRYSDSAVRWVIARELAQVTSGLQADPRGREDELLEDRAGQMADLWGFRGEHDAYIREAPGH
jgi:hypothetical protein